MGRISGPPSCGLHLHFLEKYKAYAQHEKAATTVTSARTFGRRNTRIFIVGCEAVSLLSQTHLQALPKHRRNGNHPRNLHWSLGIFSRCAVISCSRIG